MKCTTCSKVKVYESAGFTTGDDFDKTEQYLEELSEKGLLSKSADFSSKLEYYCCICESRWKLIVPDNAMRGGLKFISNRVKRMEELQRKLCK